MFSPSQFSNWFDCLWALTAHRDGKNEKARELLDRLTEQMRVEEDNAWLPASSEEWWRWWNSEVEINAWLLRAFVVIDRENPLTTKLVNGLVEHRTSGTHWKSTRDSALAVLALSDYLVEGNYATTKVEFDYSLDGMPSTHVSIEDSLLSPNSIPIFDQTGLSPGEHALVIKTSSESPVSFVLMSTCFRSLDSIPATNHGLSIQRTYRRVGSNSPDANHVKNFSKETFSVGDLIEVELRIQADRDYEYLAFEDPKPAGCEPVQLQSGSSWQNGLWGNVELRDEKAVFFTSRLSRGEHVVRYQLRAETPGEFRVLPTLGDAMYAPEIRGRSSDDCLTIRDEN